MAVVIKVKFFKNKQKDVAKEFGKHPGTISKLMKSPGAQRLIAHVTEVFEDPLELTRELAKANALDLTMDRYMALEWAKEQKDPKVVDAIAKDLAAIGGIQAEPKKTETTPVAQTIHLHFDSPTLNAPIIESDFEVVDDDTDS
jgi:hypothetical protein